MAKKKAAKKKIAKKAPAKAQKPKAAKKEAKKKAAKKSEGHAGHPPRRPEHYQEKVLVGCTARVREEDDGA